MSHVQKFFYTREVVPQLLEPVGNLDPLVDVVNSLTPALILRISTRDSPDTQGTMASSPKVVAAIGSWTFRAVMSSSDPRKPTSTTFATLVGLLMTSCSAGELSLTLLIRSNSGLDGMASRLSAGGSRLKGSRRGRRALMLSKLRRLRRPRLRLRHCWTRRRWWRHLECFSIRTGTNPTTVSLAISSAPLLSLSAPVNTVSQRTGEFSRSTAPSSVTASRAIRWTSVRLDYSTMTIC